jgi:hypothetical protein
MRTACVLLHCSPTRIACVRAPLAHMRLAFILSRGSTGEHGLGTSDSGQGKSGGVRMPRAHAALCRVLAEVEVLRHARPRAPMAAPVRFGGGCLTGDLVFLTMAVTGKKHQKGRYEGTEYLCQRLHESFGTRLCTCHALKHSMTICFRSDG